MPTRNQFNFLVNGAQPSGVGALNSIQVPERVASSITVQLAGTFTATITFQSTTDGTNWASHAGVDLSSTTSAMATSATAAGQWRFDTTGLYAFRLNVSAFTSSTSLLPTGTVVEG